MSTEHKPNPPPSQLQAALGDLCKAGLLESMSDGLLVITHNEHRIVHANSPALRLIGHSLEHAVGRTFRELLGDRTGIVPFELRLGQAILGASPGAFVLEPTGLFCGNGVSVQVYPCGDDIALLLAKSGEVSTHDMTRGAATSDVSALASLGTNLLAARDIGETYKALSEELRKVLPGVRFYVSALDEPTQSMYIHTHANVGPVLNLLISALGVDPQALRAPLANVSAERMAQFISGKLTVMPNGLADIALGTLPVALCRVAERILGIAQVQTIGLAWEGRLFGSMTFVPSFHGPIPAAGLIEAMARQTALALQRVNIEQRLRQAQKMEAIGVLAGGIAHDFNNILNVILGYSELTLAKLPAGSHERGNLEKVSAAAQRAARLVRQILTFSRNSRLERLPINPAPVVQEVLQMMRSTLPATIAIKSDVAENPGTIAADPEQIHQLVMNLCTNAAQAMGHGGELRVKLDQLEIDASSESITRLRAKPGRYVRLVVSDTGHGMDARILERIFEPFFTTKGVGKGTGLGLSVVHGIVERHEGEVVVESTPSKGSVFTVYLPLMSADAAEAPKKLGQTPSGGSERLLLVDDEPTLVDLSREILEDYGYTVSAFGGSIQALAAFKAKPDEFDLLVTDFTMPGINGVQLASQCRAVRPGLPVILCSGYGESIGSEALERAGVAEYLPKPIEPATLVQAVRRVLDRRPAAS